MEEEEAFIPLKSQNKHGFVAVDNQSVEVGKDATPDGGLHEEAPVKKSKPTKCMECNITLNSEEQALSHYGGKSHQNRVKELGIALPQSIQFKENQAFKATRCEICKLTMNSEAQVAQHYAGKSHLNRVKEVQESGLQGTSPNEAKSVEAATTAPSTICTTCGVMLNSVLQAKAHYEGKSHQLKCSELGTGSDFGFAPAARPRAPKKARPPAAPRLHPPSFGGAAPSSKQRPPAPPRSTHHGGETYQQHEHSTRSFPSGPPTLLPPPPAASGLSLQDPIGMAGGHHQTPPENPLKRKAVGVVCSACCLVLNSEMQAAVHFASQRHLKRSKIQHEKQKTWNSVLTGETPEMTPRKNRFFCQHCQLSVNSMAQLTAHMQGHSHLSKLQMGQHPFGTTSIGKPGELSGMPLNTWTEMPGNKNGWFYCRLCNISVPTSLALSQHIQTSVHLERKYQDNFMTADGGQNFDYTMTMDGDFEQSQVAPEFYAENYNYNYTAYAQNF